ncbi:hypothetical protein BJX65DRAFT_303115 [Aspergillus insuetus]
MTRKNPLHFLFEYNELPVEDQAQSPLFQQPPEIRTLIYEAIFEHHVLHIQQWVPRKLAATEELQPRNLLLIHSAAGQPARYSEAFHLLYNRHIFDFPNSDTLILFRHQADALFLEDKDKAFARYEYVFSILSFQPLLQKSTWIEERAEIFEPMKLLKQRLKRFDVVLSAYDTVLGDDTLHVIREYVLMWESFRLDMRDMEGWQGINPACRVVAIHDSFQNVGLGGKLASERDSILEWKAEFKGDKTGFEPPSDITEFRLFHRWDGAQEGKENYDEETASGARKAEMWRVHDKYAEIIIDRRMKVVPWIEYKYKYPGLPGSEPAKVKYFYAP